MVGGEKDYYDDLGSCDCMYSYYDYRRCIINLNTGQRVWV